MLLGDSRISVALKTELGEFLQRPRVLLFPTGWGAAFGAMRGLVRRNDHIVLNQLAHNSLQSGARSASENVSFFDHNSVESTEQVLRSIRARDAHNAILLATESVFSMDADSPDLRRLGGLCREHSAAFLVEVAHDLGALGPAGLGRLHCAFCTPPRKRSSWLGCLFWRTTPVMAAPGRWDTTPFTMPSQIMCGFRSHLRNSPRFLPGGARSNACAARHLAWASII